MGAFHFEMDKNADFNSNLLVSWELVTEGYQGRPMKGMVILLYGFLMAVMNLEFLNGGSNWSFPFKTGALETKRGTFWPLSGPLQEEKQKPEIYPLKDKGLSYL